MPVPEVPWSTVAGAAPPPAYTAECIREAEYCSIGLPGEGRVRVDGAGATVIAPDEESAQRLRIRLGAWAQAEWLARQGHVVMRGCAVAKDGQALVLTGIQRSGCTITGLLLAKYGWHLLADGNVVFSRVGTVMSGDGTAVLDDAIAATYVDHLPSQPLAGSGRARRRISPEWVRGDLPVAVYGRLIVTQQRLLVKLTSSAPGTAWQPGRDDPVYAALPTDAAPLPSAPVFSISRQQSWGKQSAAGCEPDVIAATAADFLESVT